MRQRPISELIELMQPAAVELVGDDVLVGPDVVTDHRGVTPGALFVAIEGSRVDGHTFAQSAVAGGAAAIIGNFVTHAEAPHLLAADSVEALSWLARGLVAEARARGMVSVGVTGSSGKTSTKDLLAQVFEAAGATVSPAGSFNNEIGVPLTACRVDDDTAYLVSELGSRGIGHISWLTSIVGLDIGVCLNVGRAHVGEFGSLETTAQAKSEIVAGLSPEGWAVLNAEDAQVAAMAAQTRARIAWFGEGELPPGQLRVTARGVTLDRLSRASFELVVDDGSTQRRAPVRLAVLGRHQVSNSLAAAAAALAAGLDLDAVAQALTAAQPRSSWRMEVSERADGAIILNDAYNANPDSMEAALSALATISAASGGRAVAVLGDMLELGPQSAQLHERLGRRAGELGVAQVVAVGQFAADIARGAQALGVETVLAERAEAAECVRLSGDDVVLVKGSRGVGLEAVAAELAQEKESAR